MSECCGGGADGRAWRDLAILFADQGKATVAAVTSEMMSADLAAQEAGGARLEALQDLLKPVMTGINLTGSKTWKDDAVRLADVISARPDATIGGFQAHFAAKMAAKPARKSRAAAKPVDEAVVRDYADRLRQALRDAEAFPILFKRLQDDKGLSVTARKEIARDFTGGQGKSGKDALNRIWMKHQAIIAQTARERASAGRTAA